MRRHSPSSCHNSNNTYFLVHPRSLPLSSPPHEPVCSRLVTTPSSNQPNGRRIPLPSNSPLTSCCCPTRPYCFPHQLPRHKRVARPARKWTINSQSLVRQPFYRKFFSDLSDLTYGLPSLFMLLIDSGWTMLGSILFVAFGDETNRIFTGVTCLGWLFVTILLWVRVNINTNIPADQLSP